jgi:hypothetical protein
MLLAAQIGLEVVLSILDWRSTTYKLLWFLTLAFMFSAGYAADRAKLSLTKATLCALPFVLIGFTHGFINFALGIGERPDNWSAHEEQLAFRGYLVATAMMLIVSALTAFVGALVRRVVSRLQRGHANAV